MATNTDETKKNSAVENFIPAFFNLGENLQEKDLSFLMETLKKPLEIKTNFIWLNEFLKAYYHYLQGAFVSEISPLPVEINRQETLIKKLQKSLQVSFDNLSDLEEEMKKRVGAVGWHGTFKKSGTYNVPYVWKKEEIATYDVEMPHSMERIQVHFIEDFVVEGWVSVFPKDLFQGGTFTQNGEIYCLKEIYEPILNKPQFQISLLKHETQHLIDSYFYLDDFHQEYRGKLVELYYYYDVSFLETILNDVQLAKNQQQRVSGMILNDLQQYLLEVGIYNPLAYLEESTHSVLQWVRNRGTIQQAALAILDRDTQKLLQQTS